METKISRCTLMFAPGLLPGVFFLRVEILWVGLDYKKNEPSQALKTQSKDRKL